MTNLRALSEDIDRAETERRIARYLENEGGTPARRTLIQLLFLSDPPLSHAEIIDLMGVTEEKYRKMVANAAAILRHPCLQDPPGFRVPSGE